MAKKSNPGPNFGKSASKPPVAAPAVKTTAVRNSPLPKPEPAKRLVTREAIAKRAYEISRSGTGGTEEQNWLRAERELQGL